MRNGDDKRRLAADRCPPPGQEKKSDTRELRRQFRAELSAISILSYRHVRSIGRVVDNV